MSATKLLCTLRYDLHVNIGDEIPIYIPNNTIQYNDIISSLESGCLFDVNGFVNVSNDKMTIKLTSTKSMQIDKIIISESSNKRIIVHGWCVYQE